MLEKIDNVRLKLGESESELWRIAERKLKAKPLYFKILKKSLDARKKNCIEWVYTIEFAKENIKDEIVYEQVKGKAKNARIFVIGSGPAGMFCGLRLVRHGLKPIIIERGEAVKERITVVDGFCAGGELNIECNIQFGEGGAGTFSDGKLNTQTHSGYNAEVLREFALHNAPSEVEYLNKPHIGSDKLREVVANIRKDITEHGGEYRFSTRYDGLLSENGKLKAIRLTNTKTGEQIEEPADIVVLAVGHSARDTFKSFYSDGLAMERRDFAVGVRIEHLQSEINKAQYGSAAKDLPPADYKAVSKASERTTFTFCMCPGGIVLPATNVKNGVVTNGMSNYARNEKNANSALLVNVKAEDYINLSNENDIFAGVQFQEKLERAAFAAGGGNYKAPVQLVGDFLKSRVSDKFGSVEPSYSRGTTFAPLNELMPKGVTESMRKALPDIAKRIKGFDAYDALLTGMETRFSSPVRVLRGENLQSVTAENAYPCGEGCGWSGGITSSAADGIRVAEKIVTALI